LRRLTRVAAREDPGVRRAKAGVHLESEGDAPGIRAVALSLYLLASCTIVMLADGGPRGAIYDLRWILFLSDACLGLVVVAHLTDLPALWRDPRRHRPALGPRERRRPPLVRGRRRSPGHRPVGWGQPPTGRRHLRRHHPGPTRRGPRRADRQRDRRAPV